MSITHSLVSEEINIRSNKEYRKAVKNRLKELIEEGDVEAEREYGRLFPRYEFKSKTNTDKQYESRVVGRQMSKIPYLYCKTCFKMIDNVMEMEDPELRHEGRKTWRRIIRRNMSYFYYQNGRKMRNRRIFFSYRALNCIKNHHKLTLKFREGKTIQQMGFSYKH